VSTNIWSLWHKIISNRKTQPKCWLAQGKEYQKTSTKETHRKTGKGQKRKYPYKTQKKESKQRERNDFEMNFRKDNVQQKSSNVGTSQLLNR
jgi:hypothetical protein